MQLRMWAVLWEEPYEKANAGTLCTVPFNAYLDMDYVARYDGNDESLHDWQCCVYSNTSIHLKLETSVNLRFPRSQ